MADISFNIACKELKIEKKLLNLISSFSFCLLYDHGFQLSQVRSLVKSYANEDKCKQWRQQRFAY